MDRQTITRALDEYLDARHAREVAEFNLRSLKARELECRRELERTGPVEGAVVHRTRVLYFDEGELVHVMPFDTVDTIPVTRAIDAADGKSALKVPDELRTFDPPTRGRGGEA